jgi:hypothetical protein
LVSSAIPGVLQLHEEMSAMSRFVAGLAAGNASIRQALAVVGRHGVDEDAQDLAQECKDGNVYMFLTPTSGDTKMPRFGIDINGNGQEVGIDSRVTLPVGEWHHVAVVLGPSGGTLNIEGLQVGENASIPLRPADLGNTPNNFIGRSQVAADPYLNGSIDEFRVYNRALSPGEVQTLYTNRVPPARTI